MQGQRGPARNMCPKRGWERCEKGRCEKGRCCPVPSPACTAGGGGGQAALPRRRWPRCPSSRALLLFCPAASPQFIALLHQPAAGISVVRNAAGAASETPALPPPAPSHGVPPHPSHTLCQPSAGQVLAVYVSLRSSLQQLAQEGPGVCVCVCVKRGAGEGGARWDTGLALPGAHRPGSESAPRLFPSLGVNVWGGQRGTPGAGSGGG